MADVLIREEKPYGDRDTEREGSHRRREAKIGGIHLPARKFQGLPANTKSQKRQGGILLYRFQRKCAPNDSFVLDLQTPEVWEGAFLFF